MNARNHGLSSESAILVTKFQLWELVLFEVMLSYYRIVASTNTSRLVTPYVTNRDKFK